MAFADNFLQGHRISSNPQRRIMCWDDDAVFGVTAYRVWPRLSFLFFIGTLAAHFGHTDFVTNLASANTSDLLTGFIADSRTAIFEIILAASAASENP